MSVRDERVYVQSNSTGECIPDLHPEANAVVDWAAERLHTVCAAPQLLVPPSEIIAAQADLQTVAQSRNLIYLLLRPRDL